MWLTGFQKPDFRTINKFRSEKLKDSIEEIFVAAVKLLNRKGYVSLEKYFVDGTKIESAANRYTSVRKKAVEKNGKKLDEKLRVFLKDVDEITHKENQLYGDKDFAETGDDEPVTSEEIKAAAAQINKKLAEINNLDDEESRDVKKTEKGQTADRKRLPPPKREIRKGKRDLQRQEQLLKNRRGRDFHADERRPHAERAAQTRLQHSGRN